MSTEYRCPTVLYNLKFFLTHNDHLKKIRKKGDITQSTDGLC